MEKNTKEMISSKTQEKFSLGIGRKRNVRKLEETLWWRPLKKTEPNMLFESSWRKWQCELRRDVKEKQFSYRRTFL